MTADAVGKVHANRRCAPISSLREVPVLMFSLDDMRLNAHLRLPPLVPRPVCHGYANACVCEDCLEREQSPEPVVPAPQPWDVRRAA